MDCENSDERLVGMEYSSVFEGAAHQLAALTQALHELGRHGPQAMKEGSAILNACERQIRQLAARFRN